MLKLFEDRYNLSTLKFHLENSIDEQYWARDVVAKFVSSKFYGYHGNLIMIGPKSESITFFPSSYSTLIIFHRKGCGKLKMIETISNFVHVPLLIIGDARELEKESSWGCKCLGVSLEDNILTKLLRVASYDIEKASVGVVLFRNINRYQIETQKALAKLIREGSKNDIF
jgi:ATP-dependent protease Clp ATPase subunit